MEIPKLTKINFHRWTIRCQIFNAFTHHSRTLFASLKPSPTANSPFHLAFSSLRPRLIKIHFVLLFTVFLFIKNVFSSFSCLFQNIVLWEETSFGFSPISQFFGKKIYFQHKLKRRKPALRSRPSLLCPLPWLKVQDGNALSVNAWRSSKLFQTPATCFRCDGGEKHSKTIKLKKFELIFKLTKRRRKNLKSNWPILKKSLFKVFFCTFLIIKPRSRILILWVDRFRSELSSRFPINHRSRLYWTKRNLLAQKGEEIFFIHKHEKDFKWKKGKKVRQELSA